MPGAEAGNEPLSLSDIDETHCMDSRIYILTLSGKNMVQIGLVVPEIWPVRFKRRGTFIQAGAFIWRFPTILIATLD